MAEFDDLIARLRALGDRRVDPTVASEHLTAMAAVTARPAAAGRSRLGRLKIAAAFAAGIVLGGTSLASAGGLGEVAQDKVADVAAKVNLDLPGGTERSTTGCEGMTVRNHGDFVRQGGAAESDCGKPQKAVDNKAAAGAESHGKSGEAEGASTNPACRPPWAGPGMSKADRQAARDANPDWAPDPSLCPDEAAEHETDVESNGAQGAENGNRPESTPPSTAAVTAPTGGQDDNAGVPDDGTVPAPDSQGDDNRPDDAPPSTLPDAADSGSAGNEGVVPGQP